MSERTAQASAAVCLAILATGLGAIWFGTPESTGCLVLMLWVAFYEGRRLRRCQAKTESATAAIVAIKGLTDYEEKRAANTLELKPEQRQ